MAGTLAGRAQRAASTEAQRSHDRRTAPSHAEKGSRHARRHADDQQQELRRLVAARLVAVQDRRPRRRGGERAEHRRVEPGRAHAAVAVVPRARACATATWRCGTRWRSPSTCTSSCPRPSCCPPTRRPGRAAGRSAARCTPGFANLRSALPMNLQGAPRGLPDVGGRAGRHRPHPRHLARLPRRATAGRTCSAPRRPRPTPCTRRCARRFRTYDVALDPDAAGATARRILGLPAMKEWVDAAAAEPDEIEELDVEF